MSPNDPPLPPVATSQRRPDLRAAVARILRLARKELRECLRDRRTLVTLVLMPVLLYPLLGLAFRQFFLSGLQDTETHTYRIGVGSERDKDLVSDFLAGGQAALARHPNWPDPERAPGKPAPQFEFFQADDLEDAVRQGVIALGVRLRGADAPRAPNQFFAVDWELVYVPDSTYGREALHAVENLCAAANLAILEARLHNAGVRQRPTAVELVRLPVENGSPQSVPLAALVPLVLILMTITGAVYPAIDLTAGERERGTLEVLVAAPVPRMSLLLAKYIAVVTVALLTAVINLTAMLLTLWLSGLGPQLFHNGGLTLVVVLEVLVLLVLFAAFFSAVLLALTSFARSFKEAQSYLIPLMLVSLGPGVVGILPGLQLAGPLAVVPLLNIVLLARDLFEGQVSLVPAVIVVVTTLAYALAAIALAAQVFGVEAVLYSEQGSWRLFFRRNRKSTRKDLAPPTGTPA
jgi:ABC-2 type transport system permease protein/sodium transport system permease protein